MSTKNTPYLQRQNKTVHNSEKESTTPHSVRKLVTKNVFSKSIFEKSGQDNVLNTAFSQPSSASKTPIGIGKSRSKSSTSLNACYTPSSLYRSANATPTNAKNKFTPKSSLKKVTINNETSTPECFSKVSLETPRRSAKSTADDSRHIKDGEISNLSVAVRVRPLCAKEYAKESTVSSIVHVDDAEVTVLAGTTADSSAAVSHSFQYDHAFWSANSEDPHYTDQETVFRRTALPLLDKAFEGYNACLFAYGQTGSGKSYSMMGIETDNDDRISSDSEAGIIPRFCQELFDRIDNLDRNTEAEIEVSYFEIYNEKIHDLLYVSQGENGHLHHMPKKNGLRVREHPVLGPYVVDLSTHPVDSHRSIRNWLAVGNSQRATASTGMNDKSSRSHSIFNIILSLSEFETSRSISKKIKTTKRSKISLVDLAGSERISQTCASGDRLREGVSINKSLLTLGKVIAALADTKKTNNFVPYRESVLTWLLRESLGGNSRTAMLATISPANIHLDETLATLRYACQARTIVNRVKVNEDPHDKIIRELRAEVERLQACHQDYERQKRHSYNTSPRKIIIETSVDDSEIEALRLQLAETEKELAKAQKSWMERLKEAEDLRKSEMKILKRKGLALELNVEQKHPCLVNLSVDPMLTGALLYIIPPGIVRIGRSRPAAFSQPDIVLEGPLVAFHHCSIENTNGKLYIISENNEFETYINGELVSQKLQIFHGDRLVIGGTHYFRISNPHCPKRDTNIIVDYQLAHQEVLQKQEEQLRKELDKEKEVALREIEAERVANERNYKEQIELLELEKFKYNCSKELLETEKKAFETNKSDDAPFVYTPFKSTLLDDVIRIMQHPTKESLHKTQLLVKEATQRCRELGVDLEFKQTQTLDQLGIFQAVVNVIDKKNRRKAEWPIARLRVWLDILRENEVTKNDLFKCVDIDWSPLNDSFDDTLNDSLNSSRISLDLSIVKDVFMKQDSSKKHDMGKSALMNSMNRNFQNTKKMLTYEEEENSPSNNKSSTDASTFQTTACRYLREIQKNNLKLKKLCDSHKTNENTNRNSRKIDKVRSLVEQMEQLVFDLKTELNDQHQTSPAKTPKAVRFLLD